MTPSNLPLLSSRTLASYVNFLQHSDCDSCDALVALIRDFDLDLRNASSPEAFRALTKEFISFILNE